MRLGSDSARPKDWKRHLDGWQAGAVLLLLAGSAILLAVPRAVAPQSLPPPALDHRALEAELAADGRRAEAAVREPLDVDVRAVGRELRAFNQRVAEAQASAHPEDARALAEARSRIAEAVRKALARGHEPLLALRAYQALRFATEVRHWSATGEVSEELVALGGDFLRTVQDSAWTRPGSRELVMDDRVLMVLFKKRWNELSGLDAPPFELSLDEDRLRYGFLLRHPLGGGAAAPDPAVAAVRLQRARLALIERLAARDPGYPADLARGIVTFWMGRYEQAGEYFRRHLERHPDGPYTLHAQNHLKASLDRSLAPL